MKATRTRSTIWLERVQDIVEVNYVPVSGGASAPPLKEGDAVKVRQIVKGGREKLWSGVIASLSAPASLGGNTVKPDATCLLGNENRMQ